MICLISFIFHVNMITFIRLTSPNWSLNFSPVHWNNWMKRMKRRWKTSIDCVQLVLIIELTVNLDDFFFVRFSVALQLIIAHICYCCCCCWWLFPFVYTCNCVYNSIVWRLRCEFFFFFFLFHKNSIHMATYTGVYFYYIANYIAFVRETHRKRRRRENTKLH